MSKRIVLRRIAGPLIALLAIFGCNNAIKDRLDDINGYIRQRPDSALAELRKIDSSALCSKALKAQYALLYAMALDKNYIDTTDVSIIKPAVEYYDKNGNNQLRARSYYYLAVAFRNAHNKIEAMRHYTKALDLLEGSTDYRYLLMTHSGLSNLYAGDYMADKALFHAEKALEYARLDKDAKEEWYYLGWVACCLGGCNEKAKADSVFRYYMEQPILDTAAFARNLFYYSKMLHGRSPVEPECAVEIFELAKNKYKGKPTLEQYYYYAYALMLVGREEEAEKILSRVEINKGKHNTVPIMNWRYCIEKRRGNYKEALNLFEKTVKGQDSIIINNLRQSLQNVQRDYYEGKSEQIQLEKQAKTYRLLFVIVALVLMLMCLVVVYFKRTAVWKEKLETIEAINQDFALKIIDDKERETKAEQRALDLRREFLQANKKQFKLLSNLCAAYLEPSMNKKDKIFSEIKMLLSPLLNNDDVPSEAEKIANREFDDIIARIRTDCPKHSEMTYKIYSYLFLGFSLKTIAIIMNVSQESVRSNKYRLKKEITKLDSSQKEYYLNCLG